MRKFLLYFLIVFSIFVIVAYVAWFPSPLETSFKLVNTWGESGSNPGQFNAPADIAIASNNVYVCDLQNSRIQVFDLEGRSLRVIGQSGLKAQQLIEPIKLAISGDQIYVLDKFSNSIKIYTILGEYIDQLIPTDKSGKTLAASGGLAITSDGHLFITDTQNNRVISLSKQGQVLQQWGSESGQFNSPADLTVDKRGFVYISDTGNQRVQVIDNKGNVVLKWGAPFSMNIAAAINGWFDHPAEITTGPEMTIFVVDYNNYRVQKFTSSGTFLTAFRFYVDGDAGNNDKQMQLQNISIAVSETGDVYLADQTKNQIQIWRNKIAN